MQEITILVKEMWEKKKQVEEMKETLKEEVSKLERLKGNIVKALEAAEIDKLQVKGVCTVYRQRKFSVRVPKDEQAKADLFDYIRSKKGEDVLFNMQSINSRTLNSFYEVERELAVTAGDINWSMPGVDEPEVYFQLGARKA